jgi:hypothetical protein
LSLWRPQWVGQVTGTTPIFFIWPVAANGACQKWHILFLDIFQLNFAHLYCSVDAKMGMNKYYSETYIEIAQEINGREPILSKICIMANVQENVILHYKTFYFGKTCAET